MTSRTRWRRIITDNPAVSRAAARRAPPSKVRCSDGFAGVNGRGLSDRAARKARNSASSSSLSATGSAWRIVPSEVSTTTLSWPVIMMFSISGSSTSGCSRPSRNTASNTAWASLSCSAGERTSRPLASASAVSSSSNCLMTAQPWAYCSSLPQEAPLIRSDNRCDAWARNSATSDQSTTPCRCRYIATSSLTDTGAGAHARGGCTGSVGSGAGSGSIPGNFHVERTRPAGACGASWPPKYGRFIRSSVFRSSGMAGTPSSRRHLVAGRAGLRQRCRQGTHAAQVAGLFESPLGCLLTTEAGRWEGGTEREHLGAGRVPLDQRPAPAAQGSS